MSLGQLNTAETEAACPTASQSSLCIRPGCRGRKGLAGSPAGSSEETLHSLDQQTLLVLPAAGSSIWRASGWRVSRAVSGTSKEQSS